MSAVDLLAIRSGLAMLDPSASHTASGEHRARIEEIFAPEQHAGALDPNVTIVLGARGTGKSFWAGVLGDDETRRAAAGAYPNLGLESVSVKFGYTGLPGDGSVTRSTIDAQVPEGEEDKQGVLLWRCVVLRALQSALRPEEERPTIGSMMKTFSDPEEWEAECERVDRKLAKKSLKVLVVFDALDSLAIEWERLRNLTDALLEVAWSARGYSSLRTKLFMRPDQLRDLGLRFVEVPKLMAGATNLKWTGTDLYGMMFSRIAAISTPSVQTAFATLLKDEGIALPPKSLRHLRTWPLAYNRQAQSSVFVRLAGAYMGRSNKKGRTYDWPLRHLADGHGEVTPRSFLTLVIEGSAVSARFS